MTAPLEAEADAAVRRFYYLKRLAVLLLVGLAALVISWFVWRAQEERRLTAEEQNWRKANLTLSSAQLQPPELPDDQNGALRLVAAARLLVADDEGFSDFYYTGSDSPDFRAPTWSAEIVRSVAEKLAKNQKALDALQLAVRATAARWSVEQSLPFATARSADLHNVWRLLALKEDHARLAAMDGDAVALLNDVSDLEAAHRLLRFNPSVFGQTSAWHAADTASLLLIYRLRDVTLTGPANAGARQRARELASELAADEPNPTAELLIALQREAAGVVEKARAEPRESDIILRLKNRLARPVAIARAVEALSPFRAQLILIASTRSAALAAPWSGQPAARRSWGVEPAESIAEDFWPNIRPVSEVGWQADESALHYGFARVVLATALYAADHGGERPHDPAHLIPEYLRRMPTDPYDPAAGPLRFTPVPQPFVYSLGTTGKDLILIARTINLLGSPRYLPRRDTLRSGPGVNPGFFLTPLPD